ncbi:tripartite tricarboxylate transporter TctB family protein [Oceaniglobus trochenteri]|uniref:tripartite tricarboxylate transporter TctB family protein n=1 Tax=Oceaniglobus trochenteri TaxID=2763260 RepID=UPI001D0012BD|nr:tripartite tricarboxylate transporter TctB family protein [Oceaniglobus trochenteri]
MGELTRITIDFQTSHLIFPTLVGGVLALLGLAILLTRWRGIVGAGGHWAGIWSQMDKPRLLGTVVLTVIYFSLMVPVGDVWPNRGFGFLICSIPYVFLTGLLFLHDRGWRDILPVAVMALIAPSLVWWTFTELFFLTLP